MPCPASTVTAKQPGGFSEAQALGLLSEPPHTLCCFWPGMGARCEGTGLLEAQ